MLFPVLKKEWVGVGWEEGGGVRVEKCGKISGFFRWRWLCVSLVTKGIFLCSTVFHIAVVFCIHVDCFFLLIFSLYFFACLFICLSPIPLFSVFLLPLYILLLSHSHFSSSFSSPTPPPLPILSPNRIKSGPKADIMIGHLYRIKFPTKLESHLVECSIPGGELTHFKYFRAYVYFSSFPSSFYF